MKKNFTNDQTGFTLIEILVVVSIIGILSSIIYANFSEARVEAKNKAFQSSLKEVQLALEGYKAQNDEYPAALNSLVPEFIAKVPVASDAGNSSCALTYTTDADGTYYKVTALRCHGGADAPADGVQPSDSFARCPASCSLCDGDAIDFSLPAFYETYAVYSRGGQCE